MAYKTFWEIEIRHDGLGKYRHIRGSDRHVVEQKANYQKLQWDEQWRRKQEIDQHANDRRQAAEQRMEEAREKERSREQNALVKERQKEEAQRYKTTRKQEAADRDTEAKATLDALRNILANALEINNAIDWNLLKDTAEFKEPPPRLNLRSFPQEISFPAAPISEIEPAEPSAEPKPEAPQENSIKYQPILGMLDKIIPSRRQNKIAAMQALFEADHANWVAECEKCDQHHLQQLSFWEENKKRVAQENADRYAAWVRRIEVIKDKNISNRKQWEAECAELRAEHDNALREWGLRRNAFYDRQKEINAAIDRNRENYQAQEPGAVTDYCDSVLSNSVYPDFFPKEWDLDYVVDTRTLVVEYKLPAPEALPTLQGVQYLQSKDSFKEIYLSDKDRDAIYDDLLYQITIRTLHEIFESDTAAALDSVVFNGLVTARDKTSGHDVTACVLSVQVRKEAFMKINLANINPLACFRALKGVAASKLTGLTPISPVLMIDKTDRRFVASYTVADSIHAGTNLASMDWEDFEHLIRELFEQEFATGGGEVKVTQASRDGGVDAVAFDPDPIRGGKIVIQAKRYTNTVGVAAVRDLYGTVINEGATKGILVTTANYGPDAYEFAQGKPLTLLNGSNLLHLLEKHGHQARINLAEAKLLG